MYRLVLWIVGFGEELGIVYDVGGRERRGSVVLYG